MFIKIFYINTIFLNIIFYKIFNVNKKKKSSIIYTIYILRIINKYIQLNVLFIYMYVANITIFDTINKIINSYLMYRSILTYRSQYIFCIYI